jgi:hypothetical protein
VEKIKIFKKYLRIKFLGDLFRRGKELQDIYVEDLILSFSLILQIRPLEKFQAHPLTANYGIPYPRCNFRALHRFNQPFLFSALSNAETIHFVKAS